ncbi:hypothetical protein K7432_011872, partial [Basidiobolus ranarum]
MKFSAPKLLCILSGVAAINSATIDRRFWARSNGAYDVTDVFNGGDSGGAGNGGAPDYSGNGGGNGGNGGGNGGYGPGTCGRTGGENGGNGGGNGGGADDTGKG